ncbi:restriction endonuclease [Bacillus sp. ISL-37]|nr:restriction endonuclease [Bacillus sp. ISL-37]
MKREFDWLWDKYKEGARGEFEELCYRVYSNEYHDETVSRVRVEQGDGGVDVYIKHDNDDLTVIQCKFFRYEVGDAQKDQIRDSFKSAIKNQEGMTKWILCIPIIMSDKENKWWQKWKRKKEDEYEIDIDLHNADILMTFIKEHELYDEYFNTVRIDKDFFKDVIKLDEKTQIHNRIYPLIGAIANADYDMFEVVCHVDQLMDLRAHRLFKESNLIDYLDQLTYIFSIYGDRNIIKDPEAYENAERLRHLIVSEYKKMDFAV